MHLPLLPSSLSGRIIRNIVIIIVRQNFHRYCHRNWNGNHHLNDEASSVLQFLSRNRVYFVASKGVRRINVARWPYLVSSTLEDSWGRVLVTHGVDSFVHKLFKSQNRARKYYNIDCFYIKIKPTTSMPSSVSHFHWEGGLTASWSLFYFVPSEISQPSRLDYTSAV